MVNDNIKTIYDSTYDAIKSVLGDNEAYSKEYNDYLCEKYSKLLEEFASEVDEETLNAIVQTYIEDEKEKWKGLGRDEMLSVLEKDTAFQQLCFLSEVTFDQAKKCRLTGAFLNDEKEYESQMKDITDCLESIKPYNLTKAQEILSETLIDLDYAFKKTDKTSLRLARQI